MPYLLDDSSINEIEILGCVEDTLFILSGCAVVIDTGLLASVIITFRWNDGFNNKSLVKTLPLTILTNSVSWTESLRIGASQSMTIETVLTGSAEYGIHYGVLSV